MATIDAAQLPRPVSPGTTTVTPPPYAHRGAPSAPSAAVAGSRRAWVALGAAGAVLAGLVVVSLGILQIAAAGTEPRADRHSSTPPSTTAQNVARAVGVTDSGALGCLTDGLDRRGIDDAAFAAGTEASAVADVVLDCVSTDDLAAVSGRNAATAYGVDGSCVEQALAGAGSGTWHDYLNALFSGDSDTAASIERETFGHC